MRGAVDRRVLAAVSQATRQFCTAGRGRGRGAPAPASSATPPASSATPPATPPATSQVVGQGRGRGQPAAPVGRGRGVVGRGIADAPVVKPGGRGGGGTIAAPAGRGAGGVQAASNNASKTESPTPAKAAVPAASPAAAKATTPTKVDPQMKTRATPPQENAVSKAQENASQQMSGTPEAQSTQLLQSSEATEMFSTLIQSCVRSGLGAEVDYLHRAIQAASIPLSLQACQSLLEIYIQMGNVQKMDSIYAEMREARSGVQKAAPSEQEKIQASETIAALISSWHSRGFLHEVDLAYRAMKAAQLPVGMQTYRVLIEAYSRLGQYEAMDAVYTEMRSLMPSTVQQASPQSPGTVPGVRAPAVPGASGAPGAPPVPVAPGAPAIPAAGYGTPLSPVVHHEQHLAQPYGQYPAATIPGPYYQQYPTMYPHPMYQQTPQWPYQPAPGYSYATPPMVYGTQPAYYGQVPAQFTYPPPMPGAYGQAQYSVHPYPAPRPVTQAPGAVTQAPGAVTQAPSSSTSSPATSPRPQGVSTAPSTAPTTGKSPKRGGFELQPKALELLKQSEYNELLKQGRGHPVATVSEAQEAQQTPQTSVVPPQHPPGYGSFHLQPAVPYVHYPPGYYAPPVVTPVSAIPPSGHVLPHPAVQQPVSQAIPRPPLQQMPTTTPTVRSPIGQAPSLPIPASKTEQTKEVPKPEREASLQVPKQDQAKEVKTQLAKPETKPQAAKMPARKPEAADKPAIVKPETKQEGAKPAVVKSAELVAVKPQEAAKLPEDEKIGATNQVSGEKPSPLKMQLQQQVAKAAEATVASEEEASKLPSLKLDIGPTSAAAETKPSELRKSPSLKLGLAKKAAADEADVPTSFNLDLRTAADVPESSKSLKLSLGKKVGKEGVRPEASEDAPKSPSLKLGLKKPASPKRDTVEQPEEASLPSLKRMIGRGRGKALNMDPAAGLLGVHAPVEPLLQPVEDEEPEEREENVGNLPALPFESRLAGRGRGRVVAALDHEAAAAKKKRLEEAATRAISILESAAGQAQMAATLERRKKRFSDQQFSFGKFPRRSTEMRLQVASSKKGKTRRVATLEELKDDPISYIAPEEFMAKGEVLTEFEEAVKGAVHRHFMFDLDPEAAMEEFGTNPDIDDKPLPTIEDTLEQAKPQIMAQDGLNEEQWQDAIEDVKKRAPHIESLVRAYAGPKKKTAKQKNKELQDIVTQLPPYARPELADFAKRAMRTLQGNPDWNHHAKVQVMNRVMRDASKF